MLRPDQRLAIYMEGAAVSYQGKMGYGVIRYSQNPIACVIDSEHVGADMAALAGMPRSVPVVASVSDAIAMGADVLVLGIAPSGGLIPAEWLPAIDQAISNGLSVLNGLHDLLAPRYGDLAEGQWIWDVRTEPEGLQPSSGAAANLRCRRVLMIGTDMAVGKMTSGLEIDKAARDRGIASAFVATGQIGITVTGRGIPLDAIRLDFAGGAVEREVVCAADEGAELVVIEGQGSLVHPSSSATLPLIRGSMPTHLVLCHRAGQETLTRLTEVKIPPLRDLIQLYEDLATACGTFGRPKTVGVCLNTSHISSDAEALSACQSVCDAVGLPCVDPVRHGVGPILDQLLAN